MGPAAPSGCHVCIRPGIPFYRAATGTHKRPPPPSSLLPSSSTDAAVKLAAPAHFRSSFSWKVSVAWRVFLPWGINGGLNGFLTDLITYLEVLKSLCSVWGSYGRSLCILRVDVDGGRAGCVCARLNQRDMRPSAARSLLLLLANVSGIRRLNVTCHPTFLTRSVKTQKLNTKQLLPTERASVYVLLFGRS